MTLITCYETPFYKKAKAIRLKLETLPESHLDIINWIHAKFGVTVYYFDFRKEGEKIIADLIADRVSDGQRIGHVNMELSGKLNEFIQTHPLPFEVKPGTI